MVPFAGYEMPVLYRSILAEHHAVRRSAGLFDVSHMGQVRLRGPACLDLAQRLFSNDVAGTKIGRVRYGLLCCQDGGVIDDVTLDRVEQQEVLFCVNAANTAADLAWMQRVRTEGGFECDVIDESEATALLAIQGPRALEIAARVETTPEARPPRRWAFREATLAGVRIWLSRTGYTGEDGYELYAPAEGAERLWDALLEAGGDTLSPAGLGARDTLRSEMGYALYGHELDLEHDPLEAGLERFLALDRDFIGAEALRERAEAGPERRLVGLRLEGRAVARTGFPIFDDDEPAGVVTSGTFGPSVERSIAIGYVRARSTEPGQRLGIEIRGRRAECEVCAMPFYDVKARRSP